MEHYPKRTGTFQTSSERIHDNAASLEHRSSKEQADRDIDSAIDSLLGRQHTRFSPRSTPPPPPPRSRVKDARDARDVHAASASPAPASPTPASPAPVSPAPAKPRFGITTSECVLILLSAAVILFCGYLLSAQRMLLGNDNSGYRNCAMAFDAEMSVMVSDAVRDIAELSRIYVLPYTDEPAPRPRKEGFTTIQDEALGTVSHYEDETIRVSCWKEQYLGDTVDFAEVYIAHPSQFRRAFAGGSYDSKVRYTPLAIAKNVNAVLAMNADYCHYRREGVIIHHRQLLRNEVSGRLDILLFDAGGNFHTVKDSELESSGILDEYDILCSFAFGPTLVEEGVVSDRKHLENYVLGTVNSIEPRAAIGQLEGERRYLLCTVEGRNQRISFTQNNLEDFKQSGMTVAQLADLMASKGCVTAYAMDGGQSATMILGDEPYNTPAYGGQRTVSDILYFSTALPEE